MSEELEAGRELDALIAERVMGWRWVEGETTDEGDVLPRGLWAPEPVRFQGVDWQPIYYPDYPTPPFRPGDFPCLLGYSSNMEAAWQVLEALRAKYPNHRHSLEVTPSGWLCCIGVDMPDAPTVIASAAAETAPLAICRAALLDLER